jgi:hypothetical protein|tara:strand:+ start:216 stop:512 length:297 start_codon:yes stop_codon:yes gene_type:complete
MAIEVTELTMDHLNGTIQDCFHKSLTEPGFREFCDIVKAGRGDDHAIRLIWEGGFIAGYREGVRLASQKTDDILQQLPAEMLAALSEALAAIEIKKPE